MTEFSGIVSFIGILLFAGIQTGAHVQRQLNFADAIERKNIQAIHHFLDNGAQVDDPIFKWLRLSPEKLAERSQSPEIIQLIQSKTLRAPASILNR
jgi:hypothetical protein